MKTVIAIITAATFAAPVHAFDLGGNNQNQGQAQGQAQGQIQGQAQSNTNNVRVSNPEFTYGAYLQLSSMANDRCGRVAVGIPYSAHTCNILMEAQHIYEAVTALKGKVHGAAAYLSHIASNDRTIRATLRRQGIID